MQRTDAGFTLLEMLVVVAIAAIIAVSAIPSFTQLVRNSRISTQANEFVTAVTFARSEAIKRGLPVVICRSADQTTCGGTGSWERGWIVYVDADSDNTLDAGELILQRQTAYTGGNVMAATPAALTNRLTFNSDGIIPGGAGRFTLTDNRNSAQGTRVMCLVVSGRLRTLTEFETKCCLANAETCCNTNPGAESCDAS